MTSNENDESGKRTGSKGTTEIRVLIDSPVDDGVVEAIDETLGDMLKSDAYVVSDDEGRVDLDDVRAFVEHTRRREAISDA